MKIDDPDIKAAHSACWTKICRQGDPIRRPNLSTEAFIAGWNAGIRTQRNLDAIEALTDWCRRNIEPPPADLLYAATGAVENLRRETGQTQ